MACMTADSDTDRAEHLQRLTHQVRKLRALKREHQLFVLNTAAELALLIHEEGSKIDAIFMLKPNAAAEKAADLLMQNVALDAARRKLLNDYNGATGVNEEATDLILKVINRRQQRAAAWLSLYGARAGGMTISGYRSNIIQPTIEAIKEHAEDLDPSIQEKLKLQ